LECKSAQKLTLSGEYDGTREGTFFEQLGTTGGTATMPGGVAHVEPGVTLTRNG